MSNVWFTSDQHFGHQNIIRFCDRPFADVEEMNEVLIANWQKVVSPEDIVYVPGDICMGKKDETVPLIARLPGRIKVIPGNHDPIWIGDNAGERLRMWRDRYLEAGVEEIIDTGGGHPEPTIDFDGQKVKISHFPYVGDSHERLQQDKFSAWRPEDDGGWLIHGHVHDSWKVNGRMINVGVDVWDYTPAHYDQIADLIS